MDPRREFWQEELEGYTLTLLNEAATTAGVPLDEDRDIAIQLILDAACECPDSGGLWTAIRQRRKSPKPRSQPLKRIYYHPSPRVVRRQPTPRPIVESPAVILARRMMAEKLERARVKHEQEQQIEWQRAVWLATGFEADRTQKLQRYLKLKAKIKRRRQRLWPEDFEVHARRPVLRICRVCRRSVAALRNGTCSNCS